MTLILKVRPYNFFYFLSFFKRWGGGVRVTLPVYDIFKVIHVHVCVYTCIYYRKGGRVG